MNSQKVRICITCFRHALKKILLKVARCDFVFVFLLIKNSTEGTSRFYYYQLL